VSEGLEPRVVRDYVTFLVPGTVVMTALFSSTFSSASYYQDRDSGMLKTFLASPNPPAAILLGKSASSIVIGGAQAALVLLIAALIPAIDFSWRHGVVTGVLLAVATIVLLNVLLSGLAQLIASRIRTMQGFHLVMNLVLFPLLFLSGAFFPLDGLPLWLEAIGRANPLSYAVDLLHVAVYARDDEDFLGAAVDLPVLAALAAGLLWLGLTRRIEPDR
jgi:ABC-2 type transport system permease protein